MLLDDVLLLLQVFDLADVSPHTSVNGCTPSAEKQAEVVRRPLRFLVSAVRTGVVTSHLQQRLQQLPVLVRHRDSLTTLLLFPGSHRAFCI